MKIKVKVDSNLQIKNVFEPPLEMDLRNGENTLQDLLQKLSAKYPYLKFLERGEMGMTCATFTLTGRAIFHFPKG